MFSHSVFPLVTSAVGAVILSLKHILRCGTIDTLIGFILIDMNWLCLIFCWSSVERVAGGDYTVISSCVTKSLLRYDGRKCVHTCPLHISLSSRAPTSPPAFNWSCKSCHAKRPQRSSSLFILNEQMVIEYI